MARRLPCAGPVQPGRLVDIRRDRLKARQNNGRIESDPHPGFHGAHGKQDDLRISQPVKRQPAKTDAAQKLVEYARVRL